MIENQLPQIANLVAKGTLQVSVIYGKKLQGMAIKFKAAQQKVPKMHFLAVSELLSDSLTAIYIELHDALPIIQSY